MKTNFPKMPSRNIQSKPLAARRRVGGVTLVELMVAMTLGLAIVAAVSYVYLSGTQGYKAQDAQSRMQEDARFLIETLSRDIRMAGYFGCTRPAVYDGQATIETIASQPIMTVDTTWLMASGNDNSPDRRFVDMQYVLRGFTPSEASTSLALPAAVKSTTTGSGRLTGTDVLMILRSGDDAQHVIPNADPKNSVAFSIAKDIEGRGSNQTMVVSDCSTAKIFKPTVSSPSSGVYTVTAANALNRNNNASGEIDDLFVHFGADAVVTNFEPVVYFVAQATTANPSPTLRRVGLVTNSALNQGAWAANGGQTVVTGVESLTFSYVVRGNPAPAVATAAMTTADWANVTAVNVQFSLVAADISTRTNSTTQTVGGTSVTDSKLRQAYNFTVGVRGRQFSWSS